MKMLKITKCNDSLRWYADKIGELVPFQGDVGDEYRSVDGGGFTNFVQYDDCVIVDIPDGDSIRNAMHVLKQAMQDTEVGSYAHGWHCNIAMACSDAISSKTYDAPYGYDQELAHKISNDAASRFMKILFDVNTQD